MLPQFSGRYLTCFDENDFLMFFCLLHQVENFFYIFLTTIDRCHSGVAKFSASFSFNRKRNIVELEITQFSGKGCQKYVVSLESKSNQIHLFCRKIISI